MKEINIQEIIDKSGVLEILSNKFAKSLGVPEDKMKVYLKAKIDNRLNQIGENLSKGDMTPEDYNKARRLSKMDFDELNDKLIKDK